MNSKQETIHLWDQKAKDYQRFSHNLDSFYLKILAKIAQRGIVWSDKSVLDIGCGTGVYTLHLAQEAAHITALDVSSKMLAILYEDALKEGFEAKITPLCCAWEDFCSNGLFDIVFSSMAPAFHSDSDFEKMNAYARAYCVFLGWGGKRESTLLDPIFKAHGKALNVPAGSQKLKTWLERVAVHYTSEYIEDTHVQTKSYDEAFSAIIWHLEMNAITPDMGLIRAFLEKQKDAKGDISFQTTIGVELISWKK